MLRFEAIRTEIDQVRYAPLEPYRDRERVRKECQSWQQMVIFFVRTQQHNTWQTPPYGFNNRQKKAFQRLVEAAKQEVVRREGDSGSSSDDSSEDEDEEDSGEEEMGAKDEARRRDPSERDTVPGGM